MNQIMLKIEERIGSTTITLGVNKDCPAEKDSLVFMQEEYNKLLVMITQKKAQLEEIDNLKKNVQQQQTNQQQDTSNQRCKYCGAQMKWSDKKQKYYCSELCWKNNQ